MDNKALAFVSFSWMYTALVDAVNALTSKQDKLCVWKGAM